MTVQTLDYKRTAVCPVCQCEFQQKQNVRNKTGYTTYCSVHCYYRQREINKPTKELLQDLYWTQQLTERAVGKVVHRSVGVVHKLMAEYGIPFRSKSESRKVAIIQGRAYFPPTREGNPFWKGEGHRRVDRYGYVWVRKPMGYPFHSRTKRAMIQEHILVWEQTHNKELPKGWSVHHINGKKDDNRPHNLLSVCSNSEHKKQESSLWAKRLERIRELEAEVAMLKRTLEAHQGIFYMGDS